MLYQSHLCEELDPHELTVRLSVLLDHITTHNSIMVEGIFSVLRSWTEANFVQLNQVRTQLLVIGPEGQLEEFPPKLQKFKSTNS